MIVQEPKTEKEFEGYFDLRWRILREPWGQPKGSERDEYEDGAMHVMVYEQEEIPLGIGRAHLNSSEEAQIRYMAVENGHQGKGIGKQILEALESRILQKSASCIVLNARESAVPFYEKRGYRVTGQAHTLFGEIPHFSMRKDLK